MAFSASEFVRPSSTRNAAEVPVSLDVGFRIFGGFTFIASQIFCVVAAFVFVTMDAFNLGLRGTMIEVAALGIPTLLICLRVFWMVVSAERDPENQ